MRSYFEALDLEVRWVSSVAVPIAVSITCGDEVKYFREDDHPHKVLDFIIKNCSPKRVYYVHNLTFETFVLMRYFSLLGLKYKAFSANGVVYKLSIIMCRNGLKSEIRLRCSYRLTLLSLKDLALLCGMKKHTFPYKLLFKTVNNIVKLEESDFESKNDFDTFLINNNRIVNFNILLKRYCCNDSLIVKAGVRSFLRALASLFRLPKKLPLTASSLSIMIFFSSKTRIVKNLRIGDDELIRKAYYGGRCEVFGNLDDDEVALHFDFKGMYALCMQEPVPCGKLRIVNTSVVEEAGFYLIRFKQNMAVPVLPFKFKSGLYFVNGENEGWYWYEEIKLFIEMGGQVLEVRSAVLFESYSTELSKFVNDNNSIRSLGGVYNIIGKNNNNTFYGRLGINPNSTVDELTNFEPLKYDSLKLVNGVYSSSKKSHRRASNVAISAAITSKARVKLYNAFLSVQRAGGRLLYTDTDSIVAAFHKSKYREVLDKKIGQVMFDSKKIDTIIKKTAFALPKTYAIKLENGDEIIKVKGFNNNRTSFNEFYKIFFDGGVYTSISSNFSKKSTYMTLNLGEKSTDLSSLSKRKWICAKTRTLPKFIEEL